MQEATPSKELQEELEDNQLTIQELREFIEKEKEREQELIKGYEGEITGLRSRLAQE